MQVLLALFMVLLLVGCTGSVATQPNPQQPSSSPEPITSSQQESTKEAGEFEDVQSGRGKTDEGIQFSYHLYKSSDGVGVATTVENRASPVRANKALQRRIKRAVKIIERGPKLDNNGQRIGERVVAVFAADGSKNEQAAVLWTDGSQFYYIESPSLKHALGFEKKFYR
ncbi:MAG TPA: hypothetical protein VK208_08385 [Pyrinomonadaceae bacterium]|jgi:uncharacterized protein YcfL|nr:hypothetical protein [Pyrinomonadaceae bacterium]